MITYWVKANLGIYPGQGGWHFVTLPKGVASEIRGMSEGPRRGWGAVKVKATIGDTTWETSIFPDAKRGSYVLPVKAGVRKAEGLEAGKRVAIELVVGV